MVNGLVIYAAVAAAKNDAGKLIGYLVRWRRVSPTPNVRKQLADLLGSQATVYYGNTQDDIWTDLEKAVTRPPLGFGPTPEITQYTRDGNSFMGFGRPIIGTPWSIFVEFPDQAFLSQANRFLRRMGLIGLVLLGLGIAGAFALSRNITRPLQALTEAATAVSSGNYSRTVEPSPRRRVGQACRRL